MSRKEHRATSQEQSSDSDQEENGPRSTRDEGFTGFHFNILNPGGNRNFNSKYQCNQSDPFEGFQRKKMHADAYSRSKQMNSSGKKELPNLHSNLFEPQTNQSFSPKSSSSSFKPASPVIHQQDAPLDLSTASLTAGKAITHFDGLSRYSKSTSGLTDRRVEISNLTSANKEAHKPITTNGCGKKKSFVVPEDDLVLAGPSHFPCEICHESFDHKCHLDRHRAAHSEKQVFVCDVCNRSLSNKKSLIRHMETHSLTRLRTHECNVCHKTFSRKHHLDRHYAIHLRKQICLCDVCTKTRLRAPECNVCHQTFLSQKHLDMHHAVHPEKQTFSCYICNLSYSSTDPLRRHIKEKHCSFAKQYGCNLCLKRFNRREQLKSHYRLHTEETPLS